MGLSWRQVRQAGSVVTTILLAVLVGGWLVAVGFQLHSAVQYDADGRITLDTFTRSKDVLTLLLPFLTTAVGFWLGNQNSGQMEEQAHQAQRDARAAEDKTEKVRDLTTQSRVEVAHLQGEVALWKDRAEASARRVEVLSEQLSDAVETADRERAFRRDLEMALVEANARLGSVQGARSARPEGAGVEVGTQGAVPPSEPVPGPEPRLRFSQGVRPPDFGGSNTPG